MTTERQQRILDVIREFTAERGYPPSVREIGERVGLSSSSTVQSHLKTLEKRGLLFRDPTKPRALVPVDAPGRRAHGPGEPGRGGHTGVRELPVLGKVAAGVPITAVENIEGRFALPTDFIRDPDAFMLKVVGDSMVGAAILDGDLIVVRPTPDANNGEIVVALVNDDSEATVKRFYREGGRVRLQPENSQMPPIYPDDVTIVGRVAAVIRKL
ncbi:MAG: transcriptional repressor LexA [Candidatus Eremiobacteraeota bacterium]|nr:transcriptional repressor LexA [Candidatus Eremiobacteraeota bacterium]MBV8355357.1 transcriptional repressor LexA [Candidatus Eremiobacteraeota bacterium]